MNSVSTAIDELRGLHASLVREAEWMNSFTSDKYVLEAKSRQIRSIDFLIELITSFGNNEDQLKYELCLIAYGISPWEWQFFIRMSLSEAICHVKYLQSEKTVHRPINDFNQSEVREIRSELHEALTTIHKIQTVKI